MNELLKKYDVPVPRYTSYPTVPHWHTEPFTQEAWFGAVKRCFDETNQAKGISLYIHLPFCESLCTYCACNTRITKNHKVEEGYIEAVLKEWATYLKVFGERPLVRELHLGGGTPTFFSPENLTRLMEGIFAQADRHPDFEFSFEGHPNNTTYTHLQHLGAQGFSRVSYGVQDLDMKVQVAINRVQPFENVQRVTHESRSLGYQSVNFDLVYGLPWQTPVSVADTVKKVISLLPERIAFYSYAHVPWLRPGQRSYTDADLPTDVEKRALYETGRQLLLDAGYFDIGMDHFSLPTDGLYKAHQQGKLHRNFMGYTTNPTDLLVGLGTSSISDAHYAYAQNVKSVEGYTDNIEKKGNALMKGHMMSEEDRLRRKCILQLACQGKLAWVLLEQVWNPDLATKIEEFIADGLVVMREGELALLPEGRPFIRNICSAFDLHLQARKTSGQVFSRSI
jgi:oxygen-independent coproporphyrinogen III oxidase